MNRLFGYIIVTSLFALPALAAEGRYNVLFIAVDDLRPELGCYGKAHIKTPSIDKLASSGLLFRRAYCQQAVCSPSRTSIMTGLRPDRTSVYDLATHFRRKSPDVVTLPQYFMQHGYHAQSLGKIYHAGLDDEQSWSVPSWLPTATWWHKPESKAAMTKMRKELEKKGEVRRDVVLERDPKTGAVMKMKRVGKRVLGPSWEDPDVPDNLLRDGMLADKAVETLQQLKDKPFFLAVGFFKPHLPFIAPKKYYDLYPLESVPMAVNPDAPKDCPTIALHNYGELRSYSDIPAKGDLPAERPRELVRGYFAAASFVDAQVGRVLAELDRLGLADKTIVILWGDHGWHLGEQGIWCKHTNFEIATHVPMILRIPGQKKAGISTDALVEFVDIYPTLCELAGLNVPDGLDGTSMAPLLQEPNRKWKPVALSQYPRGKAMGRSMRTDRYRYTEWAEPDKEPTAVELYDHDVDPHETVNIAADPANRVLVERLSKQLRHTWNKPNRE